MVKPNDRIYAPWSEVQVKALTRWQATPHVHPFTCLAITHPGDGSTELAATRAGWVCPKCDYTQVWAWAFMFGPPPPPFAG